MPIDDYALHTNAPDWPIQKIETGIHESCIVRVNSFIQRKTHGVKLNGERIDLSQLPVDFDRTKTSRQIMIQEMKSFIGFSQNIAIGTDSQGLPCLFRKKQIKLDPEL